MSADTATAEVRPFLFDTDFDAVEKAAEKVAEAEAAKAEETEEEEEFEEEIVPTFSEEELERAKQEAFENGRKQGADEAMSSVERETRDVVKALSLKVTDVFAAQEQANSILMRDGVGIATAMVRKLFPEMNRQNALGEIRRLIETTLMRLIEEPRIIVRIHPDMQVPLSEQLPDLKSGAGYEGRLLLKEDSKLEYGDCRLEWGDGSAERTVQSLWDSIDQIIEENLGDTDNSSEGYGSIAVETGVSRPPDQATSDEQTSIVEGDSPANEQPKPPAPDAPGTGGDPSGDETA
ncbi:MAG: FliH/SctL family protein [Rhodospirillales bacterium]